MDIGSVASLNWLPPENQNETVIDYYEITLNGSMADTYSSTTFKVPIDTPLTYKFVLPKGNFTMASVTAVGVCGEESEQSQIALNVTSDTCLSDSGGRELVIATTITVVSCSILFFTIIIFITILSHQFCYRQRYNSTLSY